MLLLPFHLLDRRSVPHSDPLQMKATPLHSPGPITTHLATFQSTPNHFPRSQSTPLHSASFPLSTNRPACQGCFTALCTDLLMHPPVTVSTTAPHIGCCSMATAPLLCTPAALALPVKSTQSPSQVTPWCKSTLMRSPCECREIRCGGQIYLDQRNS